MLALLEAPPVDPPPLLDPPLLPPPLEAPLPEPPLWPRYYRRRESATISGGVSFGIQRGYHKLKVPALLGVPDTEPESFAKAMPLGNCPEATAKV